MRVLNLNGRYYTHYLEEISRNDDTIDFVFKSKTQYMSVSQNDDNSINFIDPEGGPLISIGYKIDGMEVVDIKYVADKGYVLTMRDYII